MKAIADEAIVYRRCALLPDMDVSSCQDLAVPMGVMQHVVNVESSNNPYAIGVVGGRLVRQPRNLPEALATVRMLESRSFNFSIGLAQVNRYNLARYGLKSYETAFRACPNLQAGARILASCRSQAANDWGKAFSCYYSGDFVTGFRHGYVQRIFASMRSVHSAPREPGPARAIDLVGTQASQHGLARHAQAETRAMPRRSAPQGLAQRSDAQASTSADAGLLPGAAPGVDVSPAAVPPAPMSTGMAAAAGAAVGAAIDAAFVF